MHNSELRESVWSAAHSAAFVFKSFTNLRPNHRREDRQLL
jgi:hypothetical protein